MSKRGPRFTKEEKLAIVIRVFDEAGNVIETHEHAGDFKEP
jgi:transposase-like protein